MNGETLKGIIESPADPARWCRHFVVTDRGIYAYTGQSFLRVKTCPDGRSILLPDNFRERLIVEVRGDGESAVILLEGGDKVIFDLLVDPFGRRIESSPCIRCQSEAESRGWQDEFTSMTPISVEPAVGD